MCGMTGWLALGHDMDAHRKTLQCMTDTLAPRGRDAQGIWIEGQIGWGHRRLSIIDLEGGRQPMVADHGGQRAAAVISYTGEVCNFGELRCDFQACGHRFETQSDTEVVLRTYLEWGAAFVERLNGRYAFALWDRTQQQLRLVRDRMGVKPLYYFQTDDGVVFGSTHGEIVLDSRELADPELRAKIVRALDLPPAFWGDIWPSLYRLFQEIRCHSTVALSGESVDEVFGGYRVVPRPGGNRGPDLSVANLGHWKILRRQDPVCPGFFGHLADGQLPARQLQPGADRNPGAARRGLDQPLHAPDELREPDTLRADAARPQGSHEYGRGPGSARAFLRSPSG